MIPFLDRDSELTYIKINADDGCCIEELSQFLESKHVSYFYEESSESESILIWKKNKMKKRNVGNPLSGKGIFAIMFL